MLDFRELKEFIKDTIAYIVLAAVIAFIFIFVIAVVPVAGNSMNPELNDGDMTIVLRFSYLFNEPQRGEIVNILTEDNLRYVKRIIGLPGEEIHYLNNVLYVNGKEVKEEYLKGNPVTYNFMFEDICTKKECKDGIIPEDKYLVLGDNREDSTDSRNKTIGLIDKNEIKGKVVFRIWPLKSFSKVE